jgi:hypothetical protein
MSDRRGRQQQAKEWKARSAHERGRRTWASSSGVKTWTTPGEICKKALYRLEFHIAKTDSIK